MPDMPDGDLTSIFDPILDFSSWPNEVWGFLAILIALFGAYWLWNNIGGKVQLVVVAGLVIAVAAMFMA